MFIIFFIAAAVSVQVFSQHREDTALKFSQIPLRNALTEIKNSTGINFIYSDVLIDNINVSFRFEKNSALRETERLLGKYGIDYRIFDDNSFVLFKKKEQPEQQTVYKLTVIEQTIPALNNAAAVSKPKMISKIEPVYPAEAVKENIEGNVNLKLFITRNGNVGKTLLLASSGSHILDSAAVMHSRKLKFQPAEENGNPKNVWITMIFKYQITGKNIAGAPFKP